MAETKVERESRSWCFGLLWMVVVNSGSCLGCSGRRNAIRATADNADSLHTFDQQAHDQLWDKHR